MQYATLKKTLKGRLARFSASTSLDPHINNELNAMMVELEEEGFIPWFLFARADLNIYYDLYQIDLPTDFSREMLSDADDPKQAFCKLRTADDTHWEKLELLGYHPLYEGFIKVLSADHARPTKYFVDVNERKLCFNTWADQEYNLSFEYVKVGDRYTETPAETEEPLWAKHAPGYLIAATGLRIASMYIKNADAAQMFIADAQRERIKLIHKHTAILEARVNPNSEN